MPFVKNKSKLIFSKGGETMGKPTYENLSEVLSKLLSEKNIQQQELAKQSGLTKATISRLISGSRGKRTSFETLSKLARGLNMSVDELLSRLNGDDTSSFIVSEPLKPYNDIDSLTGREWKLIKEFRELPEERKIKIEARIEAEYDIVMEAKQARSKNA